ncbi:MAG TPA: radical SAM protein, partial [Spirochaetota bacterium]|nr:radical SAM protein [Spirochaetota bacterium]
MIENIRNSDLKRIAEKVLGGEPVTTEDAAVMLGTSDIIELGMIADYQRRAINGDRAYYGVNMNLNYTNICELRCPLCAFSKDEGDEGAYILSLDEIEAKVRDAVSFGIDEVHIVGGLHPDLKID